MSELNFSILKGAFQKSEPSLFSAGQSQTIQNPGAEGKSLMPQLQKQGQIYKTNAELQKYEYEITNQYGLDSVLYDREQNLKLNKKQEHWMCIK